MGTELKDSGTHGSQLPRKTPNETDGTRTETDTGRRGENPKVRGKTSLRNSANCIRNFGRRMTLSMRRHETVRTEKGGRNKAQATVYQKHRCLRKRKLKYRC